MNGLELHEAATLGDYDSLDDYVSSGRFDVNMKDPEWQNKTALHWACAKGTVLQQTTRHLQTTEVVSAVFLCCVCKE